ncbi:hypothetical protein MYMAC_006641 [Corallococcus macrosporus DSM 14697]|uniref:Uncharacterized protein n=1 Tax=Corallococcus macrosporus DSM 14697 TaxID=1189310 RepID=A0A250K4H2_9BACT|nr:hypothetical protein MYMAC_006641 [Corallococcus macrosporus DSM 14697]
MHRPCPRTRHSKRGSNVSWVTAQDDSHNADLPEWRRRCIRNYGDCKEGLFAGPCYDCLRMCEGQQDWPIEVCGPKRKKR